MTDLARPVGLGLAARGDVRDVAQWAQQAEARGLESVWVHDSYFERDPITYLTDVLTRVQTHPASRIEELLPHRWKPPDDVAPVEIGRTPAHCPATMATTPLT